MRPSNIVAQSPIYYPDIGDAVMGVPVYPENDVQMIRLEEIEEEQLHEALEKSRIEQDRRIAEQREIEAQIRRDNQRWADPDPNAPEPGFRADIGEPGVRAEERANANPGGPNMPGPV